MVQLLNSTRAVLCFIIQFQCHWNDYRIIGASAASPTLVDKTKICLYIWGERSEPHTCGVNGKLSVYIYIYGTCIFRIYVHPAPFVCDAIFPHCMLVHVTTVAQETRLAGQKG